MRSMTEYLIRVYVALMTSRMVYPSLVAVLKRELYILHVSRKMKSLEVMPCNNRSMDSIN